VKIYFAGAIRAGRRDAELYRRLIDFLEGFGEVLTGHVGRDDLLAREGEMSEREIYERDLTWMRRADLVVAEGTTPSLGVGYEIALAVTLGKKVFCLFRPEEGVSLSAMIAGCPGLQVYSYRQPEEAETWLREMLIGKLIHG